MSQEGVNPNEVPVQPEVKRKVEVVEREGGGKENLDEYEREKMTATAKDLERTAEALNIAMRLLDFLSKKGLSVEGRDSFDDLRHPGNFAGPGGKLQQDMSAISNKCHSLQSEIAKNISPEVWAEFMKSEGQA